MTIHGIYESKIKALRGAKRSIVAERNAVALCSCTGDARVPSRFAKTRCETCGMVNR